VIERQYTNAFLQDDSTIVALSRNEDGSLYREIHRAEWVVYHRTSEIPPDLRRQLEGTSFVRGVVEEPGGWLRITYSDRRSREAMVRDENSPLQRRGITSFEGDVHAVSRWAADNAIKVAKPRRVFLDIEGDSRVTFARAVEGDARILAIALVDERRQKFSRVLEADSDAAEAELLRWFWGKLEAYDQVCAWNGDGYDFPVIWARTQRLRLRITARRWIWLDHMEAFAKHNTARSGEENRTFSLESVGLHVAGRGKLECPQWAQGVVAGRSLGAAAWDLWAAGKLHRELLADYNVRDTELLVDIDAKRPYLAIVDAVAKVCSIFADTKSLGPVRQLDGVLLKLGRQRGVHFSTVHGNENVAREKYKGALVLRPALHGIGTGVHVYDFKSLYPTVMLTWNMSPETKVAFIEEGRPIPDGVSRSPTGAAFLNGSDGLLVAVLREMLGLRDRYKKLAKTLPPGTPDWEDAYALSSAYKVLANGFYGVLGNQWSRFYDPQIAESITQTAKWLNEQTMAAAKSRGWKVAYADTDSAYLTGPTEQEMIAFRDWCNSEFFARITSSTGCPRNEIMIAYEKEYRRLIFSRARDGKAGAKMYCGAFEHYEGNRGTADSKPEIKGLAYVRGDATRLAARLQGEVIDLLVGGLKIVKDGPVPTDDLARYRAVIERHRHAILNGPLPLADVEKSQGLDRPLKDYVVRQRSDGGESRPAHVEVAEILKTRGHEVREGTRIAYVVTDGSKSPMKVIPSEDYTGVEADRFYLWENLVYPPTKALLEGAYPPVDTRGRPIVEHDWERYLKVRPGRDRYALPGQLGLFAPAAYEEVNDTRVSSVVPERTLLVDDGSEDQMILLETLLRGCEGDEEIEFQVRGLGAVTFSIDFEALVDDPSFLRAFSDLNGEIVAA
jgi:DNA polymerase elongation subunit (family B)